MTKRSTKPAKSRRRPALAITIRRATVDDAAGFARIMGDPAVLPGLMQMPHTNEALWRTRLEEGTAAGKPDLLLTAERGGEIVGTAGLHPSSAAQIRRRHVAMIGISVAPEAQGQGVGTALMQAMCDYADRWMGVLRIELTVFADNVVALGLYRKFGFEIEGRLRGYAMRDGRYEDAFTMARIHPAPPTIRPHDQAEA
ncbi:MAG: GNAT family N-acetyltransferase [Pseudomonadota bacterium]|nr:GNAT family N-acetyltransferase [Pseudomonadota bacterium]